MRKLTIVFHDAGGGHRSAADGLRCVLSSQSDRWDVTLLNLQELLDSLDIARKLAGIRIQDTYNEILRRGWTRLSPQLLKILQGVIRLYHRAIVGALKRYWLEHPTDLVLSVIPHFNRALSESLGAGMRPPFVTLITDLADYPSHFWIERQSEYVIVGTERARQQALALGLGRDQIFLISGMVLKPSFYEPIDLNVADERERLGLKPDVITGVVLFGGHGSRVMIDVAKNVDKAERKVQLIMMCGHNRGLANHLRTLETSNRLAIVEFTPQVQQYMALGDFFIGKPGPGSISEALHMNLPVIVGCNARTLPQERYNAQWVAENGYGMMLRDFGEVASAIDHLLSAENFGRIQQNVRNYSNRALYEVPHILDECWNAKWGVLRLPMPELTSVPALARA